MRDNLGAEGSIRDVDEESVSVSDNGREDGRFLRACSFPSKAAQKSLKVSSSSESEGEEVRRAGGSG